VEQETCGTEALAKLLKKSSSNALQLKLFGKKSFSILAEASVIRLSIPLAEASGNS
jgi:hypothetical protein